MIVFTNPSAAEYLWKNRKIKTIRHSLRKTGEQKVGILKHPVIDGTVKRIEVATVASIMRHYQESGFDSWQAWLGTAEALHHSKIGYSEDFSIFEVTLPPLNEGEK